MITGFEVGAVFKIINEASPALAKILKQVRELNVAIDKARENLATLSTGIGSIKLGAATDETAALADAWGAVAKNARAAQAAIGRASATAVRSGSAAAAAAGGGGAGGGGHGGGRRRLGGWLGGGGGQGTHVNAPNVPLAGGSHVRLGGGAPMAAAAMLGYGAYEAAQYDDAVVFMAQHAGVDLKENRAKFRKMLEDATTSTGFGEHDVSLASQQELRMFGDTGGSNGVNVLPKMLKYAATEARLKGTSLEESMTSLVGLAHMVQAYGEDDVDRLAPAFSALSVRSPMTLAQQERAFGYAVPILHSSMGLDPMQIMASSVALARSGIANTKAGTWVRQMMTNAMPGTNMMSKMLFKKHQGALAELGLVDDHGNPTWFTNGKPDEMNFLAHVAETLPKIDIKRRAAVLQGLAGTQGAGALAVLSEPAVRPQITAMYNEMQNPENVNRVRNFMTVYNEQSTVQGARVAMQEFNVTMAHLGDTVLPAVNGALKDFSSILQGIRGLIPGASDKGGDKWKVGTRALEGAALGAAAGTFIGMPIAGAVIGGGLGAIGGVMEGIAKTNGATQDKKTTDDFVKALKENNAGAAAGAPAQAVKTQLAPITLNLNLDGRTLSSAMSSIAASSFDGQAPSYNGLKFFPNGDHQHSDN